MKIEVNWKQILLGIALGAVLTASLLHWNNNPGVVVKYKYDTIRITEPAVHDTIALPSKKIPVLVHDTITNTKYSIVTEHDTTYVVLPQVQKHYSDKQYDLWMSGVECKLDSINLYNTTKTITRNPIRFGAFVGTTVSKNISVETGVSFRHPSGFDIDLGYHLENNYNAPFIRGVYHLDFIK